MSLSIDGLISGLDITSLLNKLMEIERKPITVLEDRKALLGQQQLLYQDINTRLVALQGTVSPLTDTATFQTKLATSSDTSILTASAGSSAEVNTYSVTVNFLAQKHSVGSKQLLQSEASNPLSARADMDPFAIDQVFRITLNGVNTDITITTTDTLADMRDKINNSGADVTASIINDTSTTQVLVITSNNSGAANAMTFNGDVDADGYNILEVNPPGPTNGVGILAGGAINNELQAAQDANFDFNGLNISRSSNTVSDVVTDVTMNLLNTGGPLTLTIGQDTDAVKTSIQNFVDQYNNLVSLIKEQFVYDENTQTGGVLLGDFSLVQIEDFLQQAVDSRADSSKVTDLVGIGDGIKGTVFGQFKLDNPIASLSEIYSITVDGENYVVRSAGGAFAGGGNQVEVQFNDTDRTTELKFFDNSGVPTAVSNNGVVNATYRPAELVGTGDGVKGTTLGDYKLDYIPRDLNNVRLRVDGTEYSVVGLNQSSGSPTEVEVDLATGDLKFNVAPAAGSQIFSSYQPSTGPGSLQGLSDIGIGVASYNDPTLIIDDATLTSALQSNPDGVANLFAANSDSLANKINDMLDFLTSTSTSGFITTITTGLQDEITSIDSRIASFEEILQIREDRYRDEFNRMEQALGVLQAQSAYLLQQIGKLPSSSTSSSSSSQLAGTFGG